MSGQEVREWVASLLFWFLALGALAAMRVPYLNSPLYILDNDEALVGIMARRMASGEEWPLFFTGQNYGLAIFETGPAALAFAVLGDSPGVLTATIITLFLAALLPYARAFELISGSRRWGRALVLGLAMVPGWIVWSTKARGLYVGGFALTGVALAILVQRPFPRSRLFAVSALSGIIALVQPLWLVVLLPFWMTLALPDAGEAPSHPTRRELALAGAGALIIWLIPTGMMAGRETFWQPDFVSPRVEGLLAMPNALRRAFAGEVTPNGPSVLAGLAGNLGAGALFVLMTLLAVEAVRTRSRMVLFVAGAIALSVTHAFFLNFWVPRYFLPATVLMFVALAVLVGRWNLRFERFAAVGTAGVLAVCAAVAVTLGQLRGLERSPVAAPLLRARDHSCPRTLRIRSISGDYARRRRGAGGR